MNQWENFGGGLQAACLIFAPKSFHMKNLYCLFFALLAAVGSAQNAREKHGIQPGELLVQLAPGYSVEQFLATLNSRSEKGFALLNSPAADWNIHTISFDPTVSDAAAVLEKVGRQPGVLAAQWNHLAEDRTTVPDDDDWWRQWNMENIRAPLAWDAATGGLTPAGDTIVVAVLEKGADLDHPDLRPNVWFNWQETPNDGVDNDGNGYIDDFRGWTPRFNDDSIRTKAPHGTQINGIIGARGNNQMGITGVNWNVKLMNLADVALESEIVAAYNYIAKMRRLYNQTNGAKGAFVVASNASFGLDNEFAANHPLWCAVYDSCGKVGILNVGATANKSVNVDTDGDMPTSCPSEFLLTVTCTDNSSNKIPSAGYGSTSIDLGAPGTSVYSTSTNNAYGTITGTSISTPHVTGAIALLYNLDCGSLAADARTAPATCARRFRDIILTSVVKNESLEGISTTGGRLDLGSALDTARTLCGGVSGPLAMSIYPNLARSGEITVRYQTPTFDAHTLRVFNVLGQLMYEEEVQPEQFSVNQAAFDSDLLPAGMYLVVIGRDKKVASGKFLKL